MSTQKPENKKKTEENHLTKAGREVGKALARSSFQAEQTGKKIKNKVGETVSRMAGKTKKIKSPFTDKGGIAVTETMGFVAGEVYEHLCQKGEMPTEQLVHTIMRRQNSSAMVYCAIGWLTREGKITFSPDGAIVSLSEEC
ncbi:MAG: winged helix-turn-helix domain-containing protein [Pseudomonadota bacterium]